MTLPKVIWLVNDWSQDLNKSVLLTCLHPSNPKALRPLLLSHRGLASTEHVVSDADPGGCLADWAFHDGHIHHLQDTGLRINSTGCPCLLQVAPASHPPFVSSLEQPLGKGDGPSEKQLLQKPLAPAPPLRDLNLKHQCRKNFLVFCKKLRPGEGKELLQGLHRASQAQNSPQAPQLMAPWPSHLATPPGCCLLVREAHRVDVVAEGNGLPELQQGDVAVQDIPPVVPGVDVDLFQHGDLFNASLIPGQTPTEEGEAISHLVSSLGQQSPEKENCLPSRSGSQGDQ